MTGNSTAAMSLKNRTSNVDDLKSKKKKVIRDIMKKKAGKDVFDPEPEMSETETVVKT